MCHRGALCLNGTPANTSPQATVAGVRQMLALQADICTEQRSPAALARCLQPEQQCNAGV